MIPVRGVAITLLFAFAGMVWGQSKPSTKKISVILVSPDSLAGSWQRFARWKMKLGLRIKNVTTGMIAKRYEGADLQEKIRRCIREHIDRDRIQAVILGGDSTPDGGLIPDRNTVHETMWGETENIPTDIFYLSETDWDADANRVYGEWKDDRDAISHPDGSVAIGRIPVRTATDVEAYRRLSDDEGIARFDIVLRTKGKLSVSISGNGLNAAEGEIAVD